MSYKKAFTTFLLLFSFGACIAQIGTLSVEDKNTNKVDDEEILNLTPIDDEKKVDSECGFEEIILDGPNGQKKKIFIPLQCEKPIVDTICDPSEHNGDSVENINQLFDQNSEAL